MGKVEFRPFEDAALKSLMQVNAHPILIDVFFWTIYQARQKYPSAVIVVTSFYRVGDKGVHGQIPCRGLDFYFFGVGPHDSAEFAKFVNENWDYGKGKYKVCLWHTVQAQGGWHFHLQVRDETRRRSDTG